MGAKNSISLKLYRRLSTSMCSSQIPAPPFLLDQDLPSTQDDIRLIQLASAGDVGALEQLYDRHAPLMHSVLTQKLGDSSESQDVIHDIFVKLHTKSAMYNPALGKPIAWLLTIARNAAIDKLRKRSTHQKYLNQQIQEVEQTAPAHSGPHSDELELLRHCIGTLPDQQRDTLQLAYFSGLTQQEIAAQITQPLGSVKAWIRRGLMKLRDCVEGKL
jgi:RNA polymerase sigma-70 factor, ECF subfamily